MFGRYLSVEIMSSLVENPLALELGGERRRVTIMMSDLRGFTDLSERLKPEQVVQMLNAYFKVMVDVVFKYKGTINEIIGDSLLIIFGAPQEMPDRTQMAVACAIEMQNAMGRVNEYNRGDGLPRIEMGIGINEAEVIVGNIGSSKRIKYGVVGSGVNMTSRIESYTIGGQILVSESVYSVIGDLLRVDGRREFTPKGSTRPLRVFEIGGIGSPYNLALEKQDMDMVTLARSIPIYCFPEGGEDIRQKKAEGHMVRLSKAGCEVEFKDSVPTFTNIRVNFADVDDDLGNKDFYGKVMGQFVNSGGRYVIRFTSTPPEVNAYLKAHRQHSTE
jgi:adenylate cyclase